jgi:hypothetical protein
MRRNELKPSMLKLEKGCYIILTKKAGEITAGKLVADHEDSGPFSASRRLEN